jgi:hypothetical protein
MAIIRYAKGPVVYLYDAKNLKTKKKELLWEIGCVSEMILIVHGLK